MSDKIYTLEEIWDIYVKPMLKDPNDWKSEINGMISGEKLEMAEDALKFFTGRTMEITNVFNDMELKYPVYEVKSPTLKIEE
jgi:hypothetical protein